MREIKFRAWHRGQNRIYEMITVNFDSRSDQVKLKEDSKLGYFLANMRQLELMQYTGLNDKNGVEIYEGDIVEVLEQWINKGDESDIVEQTPYNLQVTFINYEWELINFGKNENGIVMPQQPIIKLPDYREGYSWGNGLEIWGHNNFEYKQRFSEFEVIGNIYGNPELLEAIAKEKGL